MNGGGDKDGYDRLILRRAKTISGLADAEEVSIWDENMDDAQAPQASTLMAGLSGRRNSIRSAVPGTS